jgi:hypothetical protein
MCSNSIPTIKVSIFSIIVIIKVLEALITTIIIHKKCTYAGTLASIKEGNENPNTRSG